MRYADCFPMVVDGDPGFRGWLRQAFHQAGVPPLQIRVFDSGREAVSVLETAALGTSTRPSFLLIDALLSEAGGPDLLEWLRETPEVSALPVFMVSSRWDPALVSRSLTLKVRSFFLKPPDFPELQAIVEGILAHWFRRSQGPIG